MLCFSKSLQENIVHTKKFSTVLNFILFAQLYKKTYKTNMENVFHSLIIKTQGNKII